MSVTASSSAAHLPVLPVPTMPSGHCLRERGRGVAFTAGHHFALDSDTDLAALAEASTAPLPVILQVTKRCDFGFCSETLQMPDPTLAQLETMRDHLAGVQRDLPEIVDMFSGFIIGLPTNATRGMAMAPRLAGKVALVSIGFDGPRSTFTHVRGDYGKTMTGGAGLRRTRNPAVAVGRRAALHRARLPYLYQIADVLDTSRLMLILPLRKGNTLGLAEREFITVGRGQEVFGWLCELRATHDRWPAVRLTPATGCPGASEAARASLHARRGCQGSVFAQVGIYLVRVCAGQSPAGL